MAQAIVTCEKMKNLFLFLLLFITIRSSAQNISGIYSGTIKNDSLKMIQNYELALSEYKGKITGYSYITFVKNDTFYYGIKRIKATREKGQLVVEDVDMLMNNYPHRPDKGVHLINYFPLISDSIVDLNGTWKTTKTKKFYSIGGSLSLRKDDDSTKSALINHLKELDIINYQSEKAIAKAEAKQSEKKTASTTSTGNEVVSTKDTKHSEITSQKTSAEQNKSNTAEKETVAIVNEKLSSTTTQTGTLSTKENEVKERTVKQTVPPEIEENRNRIAATKAEVKNQITTSDTQKTVDASTQIGKPTSQTVASEN